MKVAELKAECQKLGLSVGGLKKELAERLKEAAAAPAGGAGAVASPAPAASAAPTIAEQHAFLDAAKTFSFAKVKQLVLDNPAYANCQPSGRWTALHQAGLAGDVDMVKFLIARGADVKCTTTDGRTPWAVAKPECKALLEPPGAKGKAGGKQKAAAQSGPPPKSQKVSMKGSTAQVRYGGTAAKSGGQVQQVVKGRAAADASCPHAAEMHVYDGGGDDVYDALLNQADIGENKNKYYILQLMESDASPHTYYTWNRWGRVGEERALQNAWRGPMSLGAARADHCKKFHDKTKNEWHARGSFAPQSGKYTLLARDYGTDSAAAAPDAAAAAAAESGAGKAPVKSQLDSRVQSFVSLIADVKMMERQMLEIGFDSEKMPLGKLKEATILQAYAALKELSELLVTGGGGGGGGDGGGGGGGGSSSGGGGGGGSSGGKSKSKSKSMAGGGVRDVSEVVRLSNQFYSLIPHTTEARHTA